MEEEAFYGILPHEQPFALFIMLVQY